MPWKDTEPMEERMKFVSLLLTREWAMSDLCAAFGVSRKTGYKWLERYQGVGVDGLRERSRAPLRHPNAVASEVEAAIVQLRKERMKRGPKKLLELLQRRRPEVRWPAASTIGALLRRHHLVRPRRHRRTSPPYEQPFAGLDRPNAVWSADLKGWFTTGDGQRCDPLTITDNYSRYLLRCQTVRPATYEAIQPVFVGAFYEYGLPATIRTDNGAPFATTAVGGLSRLSIWWIKLGVLPERIWPGKPQQNGRHERMHRTLKEETASPPQSTGRRQQAAFDRFRKEYNHDRPHESLGQRFPAELYVASTRPYPLILPEITYPGDMQVRRVKSQGDISWKNRHVYLAEALAGELVGLRQVDDRLWNIFFGPIRLAQLDTARVHLIHLKRHRTRKPKTRSSNKTEQLKVLPMCPV